MGIKQLILQWQKEESIEEGSYKKALAIAQELKKEGLAIEFIARTTGLPIEEIQALVV